MRVGRYWKGLTGLVMRCGPPVLAVTALLLATGACAERPGTPLTQAAVRNDIDALHQLLENGHMADEGGDAWTALIWASRSGALEAMTVLLDAGADLDRPGPTGDDWDATPVQHAILQRQTAAVRLLLDRGADPNRRAGPGSPAPLILAAGDTDPTNLEVLLAHGADASIEDDDGVTALSRAVSAGPLNGPDRPMFGGCRVATVRALLVHDPQPRVTRNAAWRNATWWARVQRCTTVLRLVGE